MTVFEGNLKKKTFFYEKDLQNSGLELYYNLLSQKNQEIRELWKRQKKLKS